MNHPEFTQWPSVEDKSDEQFCPYCESMPDENHHPRCPLHGPVVEADDVQFCDECLRSYVTQCPCGESESER